MQSLFFFRMKATLGLAGMGAIGAEEKEKSLNGSQWCTTDPHIESHLENTFKILVSGLHCLGVILNWSRVGLDCP